MTTKTDDQKLLTPAQQDSDAERRRNEKGTESPCPFCSRPRLRRSDYIRCNPCGLNWLPAEDLSLDPRASRPRANNKVTPTQKSDKE